MRIVTAILVSRVVPGWPDQVIAPDVPLGREYRVDLESQHWQTLEHPHTDRTTWSR